MSELENRRRKLFDQMKDNSIAILFSGVSKIASEDEALPFCVNKNFYYLTGIKQEHSALMLIKTLGERKAYLFVDPYNELKEKWTGKRLTQDAAALISDIKSVYTSDNLETMLSLALDEDKKQYGDIDCIYLDLTSPEQKLKDDFFMKDLTMKLQLDFHKDIVDIYPILRDLRMVKSSLEIENLVKAIEKTNNGIAYMISKLTPGMKEHELADHFELYGRLHDRSTLAFSTIVASGKNATCLHYPYEQQNDTVKESDLILFDLGYNHEEYSADISRTYPVNGKFSGIQAIIYEAVLNCNKAIIQRIKPGVTIKELQEFATEFLRKTCINSGLMKMDDDIRNYYYHNCSHHLGLDTHDISLREKPLENGNVITVEPGLYFANYGVGVRIEDDVLVSNDGAIVLSKNIAKEMNEVERLMASRG